MFQLKVCSFLAVIALSIPTFAQTDVSKAVADFNLLPASQACRRLDFAEVQIRPGFVNGTWIAIVSGKKPWQTMTVDLRPYVYFVQPEFWGIEVVGCINGIGLPVLGDYVESIQVNGLGTMGVEIIGANRSQKEVIPPRK